MGDVIQDLRYAVRTLCKTPAFLLLPCQLWRSDIASLIPAAKANRIQPVVALTYE